jgi:hypothetical protein
MPWINLALVARRFLFWLRLWLRLWLWHWYRLRHWFWFWSRARTRKVAISQVCLDTCRVCLDTSRRKEASPRASESLFYGFVGVLVPVMHQQTMRIISVEPASADESINEHILVAAIVERERDVFVCELADVTTRGFTRREMPKQLKHTDRLIQRQVEHAAEALHF